MRSCLLAALFALSCAHLPKVQGLEGQLRAAPGGYLEGRVLRLEREAVLEDRDFIYTIALSAAGDLAVYTRLAGQTFNVSAWTLAPAARAAWDLPLNDYEFDVEGVDFSPDGTALVTAGRDGVVRAFAALDGRLLGSWHGEEPLLAVAFLPGAKHLVVGSAKGQLTLLGWPGLDWVSEVRAHSDEVRALAATPDGKVVSGSWDRSIAVFAVAPRQQSPDEVRLSLWQTREKVAVVKAGLDGRSGAFAVDAAAPWVVVTSALAEAAGIEPVLLAETAVVGGQVAKVARRRVLTLKQLRLEGVEVAVCDACVPPGLHGVLGAPVLSRFAISPQPGGQEWVLRLKEAQPGPELVVPTLVEVKRHLFAAYVNDLSVDREGKLAGVAFSNEKAERNREVYQREKRGEPAPHSERDQAALVDLDSGEVVRAWSPHRGVVSTVGVSPDGRSAVSGGWDKRLYLLDEAEQKPVDRAEFGWSVRRARFSADGRRVAVGAWTPQKVGGGQRSDPSAVLYEVAYKEAKVRPLPPAVPGE